MRAALIVRAAFADAETDLLEVDMLRLILWITTIGSLSVVLGTEYHSSNASVAAKRVSPVVARDVNGLPPLDQSSVDIAMKIYNISIPKGVEWPIYDASLPDRGLTVRQSWLAPAEISIGPAAFSSWALLGSTLAHEIEVHGSQSFFAIHLKDILGLSGTHRAERDAYLYELSHANRFGLSLTDRKLIYDTLSYYYPPLERDVERPSIFGVLTEKLASLAF